MLTHPFSVCSLSVHWDISKCANAPLVRIYTETFSKLFQRENANDIKNYYHHHQRDAVQKLANVKQAVTISCVIDNNSLNSLNHWLLVVGSRVRLFCVFRNVFYILLYTIPVLLPVLFNELFESRCCCDYTVFISSGALVKL